MTRIKKMPNDRVSIRITLFKNKTLFILHSLLRGVQELVLAASAVADPNARVGPEAADGVHVISLQCGDMQRVDVLHLTGVELRDGVVEKRWGGGVQKQ